MQSKTLWMTIDVDMQGELLVLLSNYHSMLNEKWDTGEIDKQSMMDTVYLLGNIEGRLIGQGLKDGPTRLTQTDMDLLDCWAEEYAEWDDEHASFEAMVEAFNVMEESKE